MALTRRKKIAFALAAVALSFFGVVLMLFAADLVLHYRAERSAGLNRYGYRGPVARIISIAAWARVSPLSAASTARA